MSNGVYCLSRLVISNVPNIFAASVFPPSHPHLHLRYMLHIPIQNVAQLLFVFPPITCLFEPDTRAPALCWFVPRRPSRSRPCSGTTSSAVPPSRTPPSRSPVGAGLSSIEGGGGGESFVDIPRSCFPLSLIEVIPVGKKLPKFQQTKLSNIYHTNFAV